MTYYSYTDRELSNLVVQADHSAFDEIYRRYWKHMLSIAWSHCKDTAIAQDIVQEVFLKLWERSSEFQIENLSAFLATAVKFQVFKYYQKLQRRNKLAKENYRYDDVVLDEEKLDAKFLQEFVNGIVEEMPERCRVVFRFSRTDGLTNSEIAEKINISEKGVESTMTRALKIVRKELTNHGLHILILVGSLLDNRK